MSSLSLVPAEYFEPDKYDPMDTQQIEAKEEAFMRYKSIAGVNPFNAKPSYRDDLKERESHYPRVPKSKKYELRDSSVPHQQQVFIIEHPALRPKNSKQKLEADCQRTIDEIVFGHLNSPADPATLKRQSEPSPNLIQHEFRQQRHGMSKSVSDTHILKPKSSFSVSRTGSPQRTRKVSPFPIPTVSPNKYDLDPIEEDIAKNYKVEVRYDPDSDAKVVRSPLKKLFGEGGLLGRTTSAKDLQDPRYKKPTLVHWSSKVKARVEDMTKDLADRVENFHYQATHKRAPSTAGPSRFPVSLSPYVQGDFYMQLELLLNIETNNFIMHEFNQGRVSVASIKSTVEHWRNKGRPQVLGFRYDLSTQRELIGLNSESLHFAGVNAFTKMRMLSVLAAWKVLAKEISIRTFCQPDSAVKKHLHDAEKVLELTHASNDSMMAFQEMRGRIVAEIYREEKAESERALYHGVERRWSPSKQVKDMF